MLPLISVIVPIYNVEKYIKKCLDSILCQTYKNLEIILVDDGSSDNCGKICDEYSKFDDRIFVIHKKNGGLSSARNAGIDFMKGEYVSFVDSDDFISPIFIEVLYKILQKHGTKISSYIEAVHFKDGLDRKVVFNEIIDIKNSYKANTFEALRMLLYQKIPNGAQHRLYDRNIFDDLRFPVGCLFEDVATVGKAFMKCDNIAFTDSLIYAYRIRSDSIVRMTFSDKKMVAIPIGKELFKEICDYDIRLADAAASRAFALNYQVFLQTNKNDKQCRLDLWKEIKKYRSIVITDKDDYLRKKNKYAAVISYMGMNFSYLLGKIILYKKL